MVKNDGIPFFICLNKKCVLCGVSFKITERDPELAWRMVLQMIPKETTHLGHNLFLLRGIHPQTDNERADFVGAGR